MVLAGVMGDGPKDGSMKIGGYDTVAKGLPKAEAAPKGSVSHVSGLDFKAGAMDVKPLYRISDEKYGVYWQV